MNTLRAICFALMFIYVVTGCSSGDSSSETGAITCGDSTGVYVRTDGDDNNLGTISQPMKTIQAAILCTKPGIAVRVANGTYEVNYNDNNRIVLAEGDSMYGGYSSDFIVRDPNIYPTIITDTTDMSNSGTSFIQTVNVLPDATPSTVIDGFTINGTSVGTGGTSTAIKTAGSPTITNNIIIGGGNAGNSVSYGIEIQGSPTITNNIINGGVASSNSAGIISLLSTGPVTITDNVINGGTTTDHYTYAIGLVDIDTGGSVIKNNIIKGSGGGNISDGIHIDAPAPVVIEANTIFVDDGGGAGAGITTEGGAHVIRNNTVVINSYADIGIGSVSNSIISNNTIVGGGSYLSWGIVTAGGASPIIQNNIIDIKGTSFCIEERDVDSDPAILKNNNLTGCAYLYVDEEVIRITNIADVNALSITYASDNISISPVLDSTQDYRLTGGSPISVTQGGLDLSSDFDTDKDGNLRTAPWSIGAYEYN